MRADTAAAYCDEKSVEAFLRAVGSIYPEPIKLSGKGNRSGQGVRAVAPLQSKPLGNREPGAAKPFLLRTARARVRKACRAAGLSDDLTLAACRHGGMTELSDAELTEQGIIALSGHRSAVSARGYVKRTEVQREAGLLKRRAWVEAVKGEQATK